MTIRGQGEQWSSRLQAGAGHSTLGRQVRDCCGGQVPMPVLLILPVAQNLWQDFGDVETRALLTVPEWAPRLGQHLLHSKC